MAKLLTLTLLFSGFSAGCSALKTDRDNSKTPGDSQQVSAELANAIATTLEKVRTIEAGIDQDLLLSASTEDQRAKVEDIVYGIKASLYLLQKTPGSATAAQELQARHDALAEVKLLGRDRSPFADLMEAVAVVLNLASKGVGGVGVSVALYENEFKTELGEFQNYTIEGPISWGISEKGFANASGFGKGSGEAWLLSPSIDITDAEGATLTIRESVNFLTEWQDATILYSTAYTSGNPADADWQTLQVEKRGTGSSWQFINSEAINLAELTEGSVVFAFRYKSASKKKSTNWSLGRFTIEGKGQIKVVPVDLQGGGAPSGGADSVTSGSTGPDGSSGSSSEGIEDGAKLVFSHVFSGSELGPFTSAAEVEKLQWRAKEFRGDTYAQVSGHRADAGVSWLLSPTVDLGTAKDPYFVLEQKIAFMKEWGQLKVKVSMDYDASTGAPATATWQEISIDQKPEPIHPGYSDWVVSEKLSLADFAGKKITIGFEVTNMGPDQQGHQPTWQIKSIKVAGGEE